MKYYIDFNSGIPLYIQLKDQIKQSIISEDLQPEDKLPTVRLFVVTVSRGGGRTKRDYEKIPM